ncbi:MAG: AraC family transcriptional regulator [Ignavibacteria bacterium]|nr:AraC family transcriptional regulator [Ignavibacteria bacterium]
MAVEYNLHIRNMVCPRCITTVRSVLAGMGLDVRETSLGRARVFSSKPIEEGVIDGELRKQGFALITDPEQKTVENIKVSLIEYISRLENADQPVSMSSDLSHQLAMSYQHLSRIFSKSEHITIEKYLILLKIERVKELLSYGELTLSEIAYRLKYSSVQHLSGQFKKVTGLSVSEFRAAGAVHRHSLDAVGRPNGGEDW